MSAFSISESESLEELAEVDGQRKVCVFIITKLLLQHVHPTKPTKCGLFEVIGRLRDIVRVVIFVIIFVK